MNQPDREAAELATQAFRQGQAALARGDAARAECLFAEALRALPDHPELLAARATALQRMGRAGEAAALLRRAAALRPGDDAIQAQLGGVLADCGDLAGAEQALRQACALAPAAAAGWYNLGKLLQMQARIEDSVAPLERALELDPALQSAHFLLGEAFMMLGRSADSAAQYRRLLAASPRSGHAWWGLAHLKAVRFDAADVAALERLAGDPALPLDEAIGARFALGKALEDVGRHPDAYAAYVAANAFARRRFRWDPAAFRAWLERAMAASARPAPPPLDPRLGEEAIFIVGMPRSASTLTEQILAAHREVEGGSELADLGTVIGEESRRRGRPFPDWTADATAADWHRLGTRYLERTAGWRARRPRFTDKNPANWMLTGAILAMLPGARIVDCRRDAVETCWSCFRQVFWAGHDYSYDFDHLAGYRQVYLEAMRRWREAHPGRVHEQSYEALLDDPEGRTRALLAACGLDFDPACLRFFEAERSVRTASAAAGREPLRRDTARAPGYGNLLDPLRGGVARHCAR
jgi:tetratricopeptide (TPR) repeat protein